MRLQINGQSHQVEEDSLSLKRLLEKLGYEPASIAVALNGRFVPKHHYETCQILENQELEVVSPMQGG